MSQVIYKIVPASLWNDAQATGTFTGSPVDLADGYIHFSTAAQAHETAARHPLAWEPSRGGDLFPHLYAPLMVSAALWVKALPIGADGRHVFPALD